MMLMMNERLSVLLFVSLLYPIDLIDYEIVFQIVVKLETYIAVEFFNILITYYC